MIDVAWLIAGSDGELIGGVSHEPESTPRGVILIAHGFKGYRDYGMFPKLATEMAAAGLVAHRFNFSHSGMTGDISTFARPDLFERDTWNRQVHDLRAVIDAVRQGGLAGAGLPYLLFGHSRGGATVLLTAGRGANDDSMPAPTGLITAAAPSRCSSLSDEDAARLLEQGYLESPSSRTGQVLRVGRAFLQEQLDDPEGHDVCGLAARTRRPALVVHGADDPTVPAAAASEIAAALGDRAETLIVPDANHVFNTPNPFDPGAEPSPQLGALLGAMRGFVDRVL